MKTGSNDRNRRSLIVAVVAVLISVAQIPAMANAEEASSISESEYTEENEMERIESWMLEPNYWLPGKDEKLESAEDAMELESWMLLADEDDWLVEAEEEEIELEEWMWNTNHEFWIIDKKYLEAEEEEEIELEEWMYNTELWKGE